MKHFGYILLTALCISCTTDSKKHPAQFLKKGSLFAAEEFDKKSLSKPIDLRSGSTATVSNGIVTVINNELKDGERARPVFHYNNIPKEFICHMKLKFDGKTYNPKNPWLDIGGGHRNHFRFNGKQTLFSSENKPLAQRKIDNKRQGNILPLNQWLYVTIEIKKGKIGLSINGKTLLYEGSNIETGERLKIGIKALIDGKLHMDYIRIWERKK